MDAFTSKLAVLDGHQHISRRLILSYVVDWFLICFTTAVGRIFKSRYPNRHAFYLGDQSISFPYLTETTVPVRTAVVANLIVPGLVILVASLIFIPGRTADSHAPRGLVWRRKLWEWHAGWIGLGVAYASTYMATEGLKVAFGKPRPDMLARCDPDVAAVPQHAVGALGNVLGTYSTLVAWTICRNRENVLMREGFVGFPSGHASTSFAGLGYLTLWLCAKLSVTFPSLWKAQHPPDPRRTAFLAGPGQPQQGNSHWNTHIPSSERSPVQLRNQNSAPPVLLMIIVLLPLAGAAYISASRWFDNRHDGWDILGGALMGAFFGYIGFRMYHLPLGSAGGGWAWGPRSRDRAFYTGVGMTGYVGEEGTTTAREGVRHPEDGRNGASVTHTSSEQFGSRPGTATGEGSSWR